tara:strand:- start:6911 stop:7624 length:714 start_codon:yes stop_codon:yes gene_type:complete
MPKTILKGGHIKQIDVCNLSRIPVPMLDNPCYQTAIQIIESPDIDFKDTSLFNHYNVYSPKTLYDMYGCTEKLKNHGSKFPFLPWIHSSPITEYKDYAFIKRGDKFTKSQVKKIKTLVASIKKHGYVPEKFRDRKYGFITGYFLKHEDRVKFYIVSGNHRASVCFALDSDREIPFIYESPKFLKGREKVKVEDDFSYLKVYDTANVHNWPSVRNEFLSPDEAISILKVFLGENHGQK